MTHLRRSLLLALPAMGAVPAVAAAHGEQGHGALPDWGSWSAPPFEIGLIVFAGLLYAMRARALGRRLDAWRAWCFGGGLAALTLGLVSPLDPVGEEGLFAVHMMQHVVIGDIAPLLLVLGLTGPVLRPILAVRWVERLRVLAHPVVALTLWTASLAVWHVPVAYEAALVNEWVHLAEHACFISFGMLMWASVVEVVPAPAWFGTGAKIAYVGAVRVVTAVLGNVYWWSGTPFYERYAATAPDYGFTALEDQANAGTIMMVESGAVTLVLLLVLFFRMAREGELRQELIEQGLPPDAVRRAVRYGRGEALARREGIALGGAPGTERDVP